MTKQNLNDTIDQANKDYGGSDFFKFEEGNNEMRILTPFHVYAEHYSPSGYKGVCLGKEEGCGGCKEGTKPTAKWLAWGANKEGLKLFKFGHKIIKQISALQNDTEYSFEEFPMPYPINIKADGAGETTVVYTVMPRKESKVNADLIKSLEDKLMPNQIVDGMKDKKKGVSESDKQASEEYNNMGEKGKVDYPEEEIDPNNIPF